MEVLHSPQMAQSNPGAPVSANHVEETAELNAVLKSAAFSRSRNLSNILSYLYDRHFSGAADGITEYSIGVEALKRGQDFDPSTDSIVRVEVSRLRRRLDEFYRTAGASHHLQICVPRSGYALEFVLNGGKVRTRTAVLMTISGLAVLVGLVYALLATGLLRKQAAPRPRTLIATPLAGAATMVDDTAIRIAAGARSSKYIDNLGRSWLPDRFFSGGETIATPQRPIVRTPDPSLYQTARQGSFGYDIPLKPGTYELHLHFAEILFGDNSGSAGDGQRVFNVTLNGKRLLDRFDIVLDAGGPGIADEKVFPDIEPAPDGFLHLQFSASGGGGLLNGIEVLPGTPGRMLPVRIVAGQDSFQSGNDTVWGADRFFLGGRATRTSRTVTGTDAPGLFAGERFGSFSYAIPVAMGHVYSMRLLFAEDHFGAEAPGGEGSRLFDVYCNGAALVRKLDIFKEAGGANRAFVKTFHRIAPTAQGKLLLSFVPLREYPLVNGIEVEDSGR